MTRHLFILRHAQTHGSQHYNSDKERELNQEGILETAQTGKFLKASHYNINLIMASDAERATATAHLIASEISYPINNIKLNEKIYSDNFQELIKLLHGIPDSASQVLLVGHYPAIVDLTNYLSHSQKTNMKTCELNILTFHQSWAELNAGCAEYSFNYHPTDKL